MITANHRQNQPVLTIFFQLDPFNPTIGGIQTCIKYILKYAPRAFHIQLVGIALGRADAQGSQSVVGQWQSVDLYGREFDFLPLLRIEDDNTRRLIPTTVKYALALRKYLKRHSITSDFYQFHRIEPTVFTQGLSGIKLLYIHNDIYQEVKGQQKGGILWKRFPWAYFALERQLVGQFDRILSCNSKSTQLYQQQYPDIAERVSYLRNTFDGELFYPPTAQQRDGLRTQLAQKLHLPRATRFILFAGRLHPQKQPDLLIQTMAQLKHQGEDVSTHLLIVGKGEMEEAIKEDIERLGLRSHVSLLGSLPQSKLADLYRTCDLFALTSAYEGLARGSLEALACGTPVVTTRAGETPSFLEEDSGLVSGNTPEAIAQAWQQVLQNPQAFPAEACARVAQPYEARRVVTTLYGDLLTQWQKPDNDCCAQVSTQNLTHTNAQKTDDSLLPVRE
ncbi:MAG: glycosyltransferase family 4 protein [Phormidesmis sp.]